MGKFQFIRLLATVFMNTIVFHYFGSEYKFSSTVLAVSRVRTKIYYNMINLYLKWARETVSERHGVAA